MNKIIVVVGPTASGKTQLAVKIAGAINGEIINADAFQVYRELNAGVNKPTVAELNSIKFFLVNNISISEDWNIKFFQEQAQKIITDIINRKRIPIICGGSHLYIDALIKQYDLSQVNSHSQKYQSYTIQQLSDELESKDYDEFIKIGKNKRRLIRALEIIDDTKMQKSKHDVNNSYVYDCQVIRCDLPREQLYQKINLRVDEMCKNGWKKEVEELKQTYPNLTSFHAFKAIGYQEIYDNLFADENGLFLETIKQKTRNFAKRQITWSKNRYPNHLVYNENYVEILNEILEFLNG